MSKRNGRTNGFPIYRTYHFSGKDPAIVDVLKVVGDDKTTSEKSNVSRSTLRNWRGKTRRPQFATLQAVAIANGKRFRLMDD